MLNTCANAYDPSSIIFVKALVAYRSAAELSADAASPQRSGTFNFVSLLVFIEPAVTHGEVRHRQGGTCFETLIDLSGFLLDDQTAQRKMFTQSLSHPFEVNSLRFHEDSAARHRQRLGILVK